MSSKHAISRSVAFTAFVFGLLVWGYVVLVQLVHPDWVTAPFSHVRVFPFDWRLDEVGMVAFAVSAIGFLLWQIQGNMKSNEPTSNGSAEGVGQNRLENYE